MKDNLKNNLILLGSVVLVFVGFAIKNPIQLQMKFLLLIAIIVLINIILVFI